MKIIRSFLDAIGWSQGQKIEYVISSHYQIHNNGFYHCVAESMAQFIRAWGKYLEREKNLEIGSGNLGTFITIVREAIKNASDHGNDGNENKQIHVVIWTGEKGFLASVRDEGEFFKSSETKKHFEEKTPLNEDWRQKTESNYGLGLKFIFATDELFVDMENGILYILYLFK